MTDNELTGGLPDGEATPEINIPVQDAGGAPLVSDNAAPPAAAEPVQDTPEAAADADEPRKPVQKLPDWADKKLREAAFSEREAKRKAKELEAEIERLRAGSQPAPTAPNAADTAAASANAPAGGYGSPADFNAAVQAEASRRAQNEAAQRAEADFNAACNNVWNKGSEAYKGDFQQAVANLQSVGVMNRDVLDLVLATEDPAKVLFDLGSDPDKASALLDMSPAKRAVEIAKLAVAPVKKTPDPLSNAPAPVRPVEGGARVMGEPRDEDDDATYFAKRVAQKRERQRA
jgi:hypothetical protein